MSTGGSLIDSTNGGASFNNVTEFDTYKQEDNDTENKYSEFHDVLELFFSCYFDRYNPFFKINMKTMIRALVRQSEPTTIQRILALLPRKGQELGIRFFGDNNIEFWKAVAKWEKILCDCDTQVPIETVPKILNREEMYLAHWNARVAFAVDRHAEASKKSRLAHATLYPQSTKRRRMSKDGTRFRLSISHKYRCSINDYVIILSNYLSESHLLNVIIEIMGVIFFLGSVNG